MTIRSSGLVDIGAEEDVARRPAGPCRRVRRERARESRPSSDRPVAGDRRRDEEQELVDEPGARGTRPRSSARPRAAATARPPRRARRARPRAARRRSSSAEPAGSGPRPNASRRGWRGGVDAARGQLRIVGAHGAHPDRRPRPRLRAARGRAGGSPRPRPSASRARSRGRRAWRPASASRRAGRSRSSVATPRSARAPRTSRRARPRRPARAAARARRRPPGSGRASRRRPARLRQRATASVQGGVVPWWAHGSIVTYRVAPLARSPAASSATTSACGPPRRSCQPSPTTSPPGATTTAPTTGFGCVVAAAALGELERALQAQASAWTSRR